MTGDKAEEQIVLGLKLQAQTSGLDFEWDRVVEGCTITELLQADGKAVVHL